MGAGLWFAYAYIGQRFRFEVWGWLLLLPLPIILMLLGEPIDHRLHPEAWVRTSPPPSSLEYAIGWPEVALLAYGCLLALLASGIILRRLSRRRIGDLIEIGIVLAVLGLPPLAGVVSLALGARWLHQRDTMPLVFGLADLVAAVGLFRGRLFELPAMALERVVEGLADGVAVCSVDGRIVEANPALVTLLALPGPPSPGTHATSAFASWPGLAAVCVGDLDRSELAVDGRTPRWLDAVGTPVRDWRGQAIGRTVLLRDVTASKQASQRRFQAVFEHAFELIALLARDGTILEVNRTALAFGGVSGESLRGRPLWEAPWWAHSSTLRDELRAALAALENGKLVRFEVTHLRCDAYTRYFDFSLTAVPDDAGAVEYVIAEARDVTELLQAQKDNVALTDKLAQARRLEVVGRMAAGIAHDFNNLLVAVMGSVQVVKLEVPDGSSAARGLEVIQHAADAGAALSRQLLMLASPRAALSSAVDVAVVVQRAATLIAPVLGSAVSLTVHAPPALWPVRIDPGQLEQALLNLATNARDAMPAGGALLVSADNVFVTEARKFQGDELAPGRYVLVRVTDTGNGMSDEVIERALEPFFTTKGAGGTGLGLALVHALVHGNGGFLELASLEGRWTEVRMFLPASQTSELADGVPAPLPGQAAQTHERPRQRGAVLVVEDERPLRTFICEQLSAQGYQVQTFADAAALHHATARMTNRPTLLISDLVLPETTGFALADQVRQHWPDLQVLFLSGFPASARHAEGRGHVRFLSKPFDAAGLSRAVAATLKSGEADRP
jgi:PAS domain S-box-containing protein